MGTKIRARDVEVGLAIDGRKIKSILKTFLVLYSGWELDDVAWIVEFEDGGRAELVRTDHGGVYISDDGKTELALKIAEYEKAIKETQEALDWLK